MSHKEQLDFVRHVKYKFPVFFTRKRVLEVGSYDINGSVRQFFSDCIYTGLDLAPGKGVDVVCSGNVFKSEFKYDTLISTECFEHDQHWVETFKNMIFLGTPTALILFTCATNDRAEHGTPRTTPGDSLSSQFNSYYCNLGIDDFIDIIDFNATFSTYSFEVRDNDLYFWGIKK